MPESKASDPATPANPHRYRGVVADALVASGVLLVAFGAALFHLGAGFITLGAGMIVIGARGLAEGD